MNLRALSGDFGWLVRPLTDEDIPDILRLCAGNPQFYRFHPPAATRESILADMSALPPKAQKRDKYYLGYFSGAALLCVLDLILHYPQPECAYIGFFMLRREEQGRGVASTVLAALADAMHRDGIRTLHLAVDRENPQSTTFWTKNSFVPCGCKVESRSPYLPMHRAL